MASGVKISLAAQIMEVDYALGVYRGMAADLRRHNHSMKPAEMGLHRTQMQAVRDTLQFMADNEAIIRAAIKEAKGNDEGK